MGRNVKCEHCGAQVYTTGTRMPQHDKPDGKPCAHRRRAMQLSEYAEGFDQEPGVYFGGLPELGKDN